MTGLYVGIGVGVVVVILIVAVIIVAVCCFRKKKPSSVSPSAPQGARVDSAAVAVTAWAPIHQGTPQAVQMQPQVAVPVAAPISYNEDKFARLKELKGLLDSGVLSQEEFDAQKKAVLGA